MRRLEILPQAWGSVNQPAARPPDVHNVFCYDLGNARGPAKHDTPIQALIIIN